jgi:HSP20 family protein
MKPQLAVAFAPAKQSPTLYPKSLPSFWEEVAQLADKLEKRAYDIFEQRGRSDGNDLEDWFKAETELFQPVAIEIIEEANDLHIRAEIPGFTADELELNLEPGTLTLMGAHESQKESEKDELHLIESSSSEIFRKVLLPVNVDPEKATATLTNGVLEITAPKEQQPTQIEIAAA